MKRLTVSMVLFLVLCFQINPTLALFQNPEEWSHPDIAKLLEKGEVVSMIPMGDYLKSKGKKSEFEGQVYVVTLKNGLKAVFKIFPDNEQQDAFGEVAAYKASLFLGFPKIPPTVLRSIKGQKGSLQLFIESDIDPSAPGAFEEALKQVDPQEVTNLKIFYFIFGQWDSGPHNILILKQKKHTFFIAIDNSAICIHQHVKYGELSFVRMAYSAKLNTNDWNKPFPFDQVKAIMHPTSKALRMTFKDRLPESFYRSFKSYGEPFRYVIYQNTLWRQYPACNGNFLKTYPKYCSEKTRKILKKLNKSILQKIFAHARKAEFLTGDYIQMILDRRDQVLRTCLKED
jgi:hypothetical protein